MALIKIGHRLLNTDAIAHINLEAKQHGLKDVKEGVRVTMLSQSSQDYMSGTSVTIAETLFFEGEEAEALRWYFNRMGNEFDLMEQYRTLGSMGYIK